ncbi:hypothetical protein [Kitasatospora kifunensis]|uniref:Uncharacterized protein n=1 Tax=Kitasatospora kifunensis TaxID=58351 RepID=A0A7W7R7T6_KITKI|nr:hypothetical protein [Kitasatospora kifunensis]MBB4927017.1 hypothetical protein [Kitasatospora kifunensis]
MRFAESESWSISIRSNSQLELPLWVRAAERIPVPAGGLVPGPLGIDPLPAPSVPGAGEALAEGWLAWWRMTLDIHLPPRPKSPEEFVPPPGGPPDFSELAAHPQLRRVVTARWPEFRELPSEAMRAALPQPDPGDRNPDGAVVAAVEAELGHRAAPFELQLLLLPVIDEEIRSLGSHTFLVPTRVYGSEAYKRWLHRLVRALA